MDLPGWLTSIRSIVTLLIVITLCIGLFSGHISLDLFSQVSMLVVGAYFAKRDTNNDRDKP